MPTTITIAEALERRDLPRTTTLALREARSKLLPPDQVSLHALGLPGARPDRLTRNDAVVLVAQFRLGSESAREELGAYLRPLARWVARRFSPRGSHGWGDMHQDAFCFGWQALTLDWWNGGCLGNPLSFATTAALNDMRDLRRSPKKMLDDLFEATQLPQDRPCTEGTQEKRLLVKTEIEDLFRDPSLRDFHLHSLEIGYEVAAREALPGASENEVKEFARSRLNDLQKRLRNKDQRSRGSGSRARGMAARSGACRRRDKSENGRRRGASVECKARSASDASQARRTMRSRATATNHGRTTDASTRRRMGDWRSSANPTPRSTTRASCRRTSTRRATGWSWR